MSQMMSLQSSPAIASGTLLCLPLSLSLSWALTCSAGRVVPPSALLGGGGYAEYCVIHQDTAIHVRFHFTPLLLGLSTTLWRFAPNYWRPWPQIPDDLSFEDAAAIPEAFLTAYQALVWIAGLQAGKRVLIHAGVSAISSVFISLCAEMSDLPSTGQWRWYLCYPDCQAIRQHSGIVSENTCVCVPSPNQMWWSYR